MSTTSSPARTIVCTVMAADAADALVRFARYGGSLEGVTATGRVAERSARHLLWNVEVTVEPTADVDDVWVRLTSYGITPGDDLGSVWQSVPGVGKFS